MKNQLLIIILLTLSILLISTNYSSGQDIFKYIIKYDQDVNEIVVKGKLNAYTKEITVQDADLICNELSDIYHIVEELKFYKASLYKKKIKSISKTFILPFEEQIKKCEKIEIILDKKLMIFSIGWLQIDDVPLAVYKPITYKLYDITYQKESIEIRSSLIISDITTDPERACDSIKGFFPNTSYFSSKAIKVDSVPSGHTDLLLISAHGTVSKECRGSMGWDSGDMSFDVLQNINPKLTYFDSCQQGINLNYIEVLLNNNELNYYLGTAISNDAGDSSTKTILGFFTEIKDGEDPDRALFKTQKELFKHYKNKNQIIRINKALCFRLYEL